MALNFPNSQMVAVTVKANQRLEKSISGVLYVHLAGDVVYVMADEAVYLRRDGIVV